MANCASRVRIDEVADDVGILRIKGREMIVGREGFAPAALPAPDRGDEKRRLRASRREPDRFAEFLQRPIVIARHPIDSRDRARDAPRADPAGGGAPFRLRFRLRFPGFRPIVEVENLGVGLREAGMGEGELRIERRRPGVKLLRDLEVAEQSIGICLQLPRAQISIVSRRDLCRLLFDRLALAPG